MQNVGGYLPEKIRKRHWTQDRIKENLKASVTSSSYDLGEVDLRPWTSARHNQLHLGSCVAQSVVKALEIKRNLTYGKEHHVDLSVLGLYFLARELMDPPKTTVDSGTHISMACDALRRWGICEESLWPYVTGKFAVAPPWAAMRRAYINKINSFYRIVSFGSTRCEDVLLHLHAHNPVVYGTAVPKSFLSHKGKSVVGPPNGQIIGRHAMCVVGWLPNHEGGSFIIENSWGTAWGDDGFFYASPEYLQSLQVEDVWAIAAPWDDWV